MSTGYQIKDQTAMHYLTFQVVDWIDVFTRLAYRDIVIDSLRFCQQSKGLQVLMESVLDVIRMDLKWKTYF